MRVVVRAAVDSLANSTPFCTEGCQGACMLLGIIINPFVFLFVAGLRSAFLLRVGLYPANLCLVLPPPPVPPHLRPEIGVGRRCRPENRAPGDRICSPPPCYPDGGGSTPPHPLSRMDIRHLKVYRSSTLPLERARRPGYSLREYLIVPPSAYHALDPKAPDSLTDPSE